MSFSKGLFLKVGPHQGYDDFYFKLDPKTRNWSEILDKIEDVLDEKYVENDHKLEGISLSVEIVDVAPDEVEEIL